MFQVEFPSTWTYGFERMLDTMMHQGVDAWSPYGTQSAVVAQRRPHRRSLLNHPHQHTLRQLFHNVHTVLTPGVGAPKVWPWVPPPAILGARVPLSDGAPLPPANEIQPVIADDGVSYRVRHWMRLCGTPSRFPPDAANCLILLSVKRQPAPLNASAHSFWFMEWEPFS